MQKTLVTALLLAISGCQSYDAAGVDPDHREASFTVGPSEWRFFEIDLPAGILVVEIAAQAADGGDRHNHELKKWYSWDPSNSGSSYDIGLLDEQSGNNADAPAYFYLIPPGMQSPVPPHDEIQSWTIGVWAHLVAMDVTLVYEVE